MPKKLIVCCDGTWNWPDQRGDVTNVLKMVRAIVPRDDEGLSQVVYYDAGVGTGNRVDRIVGGAFGVGLWRNVQDAYLFLASNYEPGDQIFLFGFSRGAFTVRSLAGLMGCVRGILRKSDMRRFQQAYAYYQTRPEKRRAEQLEGLTAQEARVHFIGVWDTVGSLGVPNGGLRFLTKWKYGFHNTDLGSHVDHAYHALAIDERRGPFKPTLWTKVPDPQRQRVEQVWFAGAHSNVGGGYANAALSNRAFLWMVAKAVKAGLKVDAAFVCEEVRKEALVTPSALVNSRKGLYRMMRPHDRALCTHDTERIHPSVVERMNRELDKSQIDPHPYAWTPALADLHASGRLKERLTELDPVYEQLRAEAAAATPRQKHEAKVDAQKL